MRPSLISFSERHPRHLAAHRVEAGQDDGLRRVVDDEVDAGGLLQGADVPALATDDPALHLLVRQAHDGDRRLRRVVGRDALHDGRQDPAGAVLALLDGAVLDLPDAVLRLRLRLVDDLGDQALPSLGRGQPGDALQLERAVAAGALPRRARSTSSSLASAEQLGLALLEPCRLTVERLLPVQESALGALERGALLARLFLGGAAQVEDLVLALEDDLLLLGPGLRDEPLAVLLGVLHGARGDEVAHHEADDDSDGGGYGRHDHDDDVRHSGSHPLEPFWAVSRSRGAGASVRSMHSADSGRKDASVAQSGAGPAGRPGRAGPSPRRLDR